MTMRKISLALSSWFRDDDAADRTAVRDEPAFRLVPVLGWKKKQPPVGMTRGKKKKSP